ncbi:GRB2-associated-binding protein 1-like isoform X4 [Polyodon spathula]|uniref:GRB2-associated-binding protein 1-like isoform X4 n=1 Tax=Polyodon spathula TaxID=7913 RepID=UPI001B7DCC3F|nr:GRB2-associated-binding protein 1-like isoform X4 [Polyodon spathula]
MLLKSGVVESKQQSEQAQHKESFLLLIKAWKKRWFVLRSGRLTGDPDVLEYYKNDHTKKPIRVIDLNLCEQVDAGLTFNKKDLEHSFIFDIKTIDRVFYLVADTEEEMNKWVRCICDICGFNPTDEESGKHPNQCGNTVVEVPLFSTPSMMGASSIGSLPPPYQPVNVRHLESSSSQEEPQDYLWLSNCESKRLEPASQASSFATEEGEEEYLLLEDFESKKAPLPSQPHADSSKSTSSETDCNDNVPSHKPPAATPIPTSSKPASVNGFFPQPILYDSPPSRAVSVSTESSLYNLPRSYSQDPVLLPTKATSSPPVTDSEDIYVFNTPSRKSSVETQLRQFSISYDIPPAPGGGSTYQIPRTGCPEMVVGQSASLPDVPPPRPPKPSVTVPERSPTETYSVPRSVSETDSNYCIPTGPGKSLRSNTLATVDSSRLWKDHGPQDCYDIPRTFPTDRSSSLDLNESFNSYLKNKGMVAIVGGLSASTEEMDENYVHMSANSPSHHHSRSLSEPIQEPNYMPMTPGTTEFSSLGKQVPPPAHMGFRSSPKTPPRRTLLISDCQPPPVDRNLKPDRKGQSPIIIRSKPLGLERTDSQTVGDFPRRFKVKPAPLEIKPMPEWEEFQAPVRSPVTRTFAREEESFYCTVPITPVKREVSGWERTEENVKLGAQLSADGGSSPMVKPKGDKQVEYLDLDLDSGKSTPPRKKKSNGTSNTSSDERVDYVVVDQQRTQALKNTREAWNDGRQSTESEAPSKGTK